MIKWSNFALILLMSSHSPSLLKYAPDKKSSIKLIEYFDTFRPQDIKKFYDRYNENITTSHRKSFRKDCIYYCLKIIKEEVLIPIIITLVTTTILTIQKSIATGFVINSFATLAFFLLPIAIPTLIIPCVVTVRVIAYEMQELFFNTGSFVEKLFDSNIVEKNNAPSL